MLGKQLYIIYSYYQLLISLIESAKNPDGENNFLIWNQNNMFSSFFSGLKKYPFINKVIILPHELNDFTKKGHSIKKYYNYYQYNINWYNKFIDFKELDKLTLKSEINIFLLTNALTLFIVKRYKNNFFRFIEEGEVSYAQSKTTIINWVKRNIYGIPFDDKENSAIREIWVKFPDRLNIKAKEKIRYYNSQEEFLKLDIKRTKHILKVFNASDLINFKKPETKTTILLTQPLSEDKLLSEEQKINSYKKIVKQYVGESTLIIKVHPREKTDYKSIFPDAVIIRNTFPVELFNVISVSFDKAVTIFSSAIHNLYNVSEKIYLGVNWNADLENSMKKRYKSL